jgi:hypothetical protein
MGIQLDWQVEADRARQFATEDPEAKHQRQRRRRRVLIAVLIVAAILTGTFLAVKWRLNQVEDRIEQDLINTVEVELAALRINNRENFMSVQRSASEEWLDSQRQLFDEYQDLKQARLLTTDYNIVDVTFDEDPPRGRVLLEYEIGDRPYRMAWFYWRYNDLIDEDSEEVIQNGWRHVPPDTEFWGKAHDIDRANVHLNYNDLDKELAQSLAPRLQQWWSEGCVVLQCSSPLPKLTVNIVPETMEQPRWNLYDRWTIDISSPLIFGRAPVDVMPPPELFQTLLDMLSQRMIDHRLGLTFSASPYSDAYWINDQLSGWLQANITDGQVDGSAFINSLNAQFGDDFANRMLQILGPQLEIGYLQNLVGVPVDDLADEQLNALVWTDFFQWRLQAEQQAIIEQNDIVFRNLYDTSDGNALALAQQEFTGRDVSRPVPQVLGVVITRDELGRRVANVNVAPDPNNPSVQVTLIYRWSATTWKRIS